MVGPSDRSVSMLGANLLAVLAGGPPAVLLAIAYASRWGAQSLIAGVYGLLEPRLLLLALLPGILAHELIHALAWATAARRPLSAIQLGIRWRYLAPYAHPRVPITARAYRIGAAMPLVVLGLAPALVALGLGAPRLMAYGLFFVFTAGGDLLALWLMRGIPPGRMVEDHPTRVGCHVLPDPPATSPPSAASATRSSP